MTSCKYCLSIPAQLEATSAMVTRFEGQVEEPRIRTRVEYNFFLNNNPKKFNLQHHRYLFQLRRCARSCKLCAWFVADWNEVNLQLPKSLPRYLGAVRIPMRADWEMNHQKRLEIIGISFFNEAETLTIESDGPAYQLYQYQDSSRGGWREKILGRPIDSAKSIGIVHEWLNICDTGHNRCYSMSSYVPHRLLLVGSLGDTTVRLIEGKICNGPYTTLSHCWGKMSPIRTTKRNLKSHEAEISLTGLTKTFFDAIMITRELGVKYLWIDSLCIVQDDAQEWAANAGAMSEVYLNSYLTIAADSAEDGHGGCLYPARKIDASLPLTTESEDCIWVRGSLSDFYNSMQNQPLHSRAWVLQERYLSPRILHCTSEQLFWECRQMCCGEDGRSFEPEVAFERDLVPENLPGEANGAKTSVSTKVDKKRILFRWDCLTMDYARRDLTYGDDKLPAISGLAYIFSRWLDDEYIAGMWRSQLVSGMCWRSSRNTRLPAKMRVPSWSWSAYDGFMSNQTCRISEEYHVVSLAVVDTIQVETEKGNPLGRILSAFIVLTGQAIPITKIKKVSGRNKYSVFPFLDTCNSYVYFDPLQGQPHEIIALRLISWEGKLDDDSTWTDMGLMTDALLITQVSDGRFRRIGLLSLHRQQKDWFEDLPFLNYKIV